MGFRTSQVARSTPFDNNTNLFTSTEVQSAIEEARDTALGRARYALICAFDGSAGSGRWLEWSKSVPSNTSPFACPRVCALTELSFGCNTNNANTTITVFKNNVAFTTIQMINQKTKTEIKTGLDVNIGDLISVQTTGGTSSRPVLFLFFEIVS
jgi:hypothetical protein